MFRLFNFSLLRANVTVFTKNIYIAKYCCSNAGFPIGGYESLLLLAGEILVPCGAAHGSTDQAFGIIKVLDRV
jgi:hypothetical protein